MKKPNPNDLTKRNNDARKKDHAALKARVRVLAHTVRQQGKRLQQIERALYLRQQRSGPYD